MFFTNKQYNTFDSQRQNQEFFRSIRLYSTCYILTEMFQVACQDKAAVKYVEKLVQVFKNPVLRVKINLH